MWNTAKEHEMKPRIKVYCWDGIDRAHDVWYWQFPNGRVCRVEWFDRARTLQEIYDDLQVPFLFF